jgi:hypothetical protein
MRDVETELGQDAIVVIVGSPDELSAELATRRPDWLWKTDGPSVTGWVLDSDGVAGIGLSNFADLDWEEVVIRVAETIQEGLIEGTGHLPFPVCRTHGVHPMDAAIAANVPSWRCPKGTGHGVPIGALGPLSQS